MINLRWKDIPGYEGLYKASPFGMVKAIKRSGSKGKILKCQITRGYKKVLLSKNNKRHMYSLHRLICMTFKKNPLNLKTVNHKDGNKLNNNIKNLEWCSAEANSKHARDILGKNSIGENNGNHKLTKREVNFLRWLKYIYPQISGEKIAKFYKMSGVNIYHILNNKLWRKTC